MPDLRLPVSVAAAAAVVLAVLAVPGAAAPAPTRTSAVVVRAPAQFNLTLAAVGFRAGAGRPLRLRLRAAPGLYFVAAALVRRPGAGGPRALVLAVNRRPRGSLAADRLSIGLAVTAARRLGAAVVRQVADPLRRPVGGGGASAAVCGPAGQRRTLAAGDLRALLGDRPGAPGLRRRRRRRPGVRPRLRAAGRPGLRPRGQRVRVEPGRRVLPAERALRRPGDAADPDADADALADADAAAGLPAVPAAGALWPAGRLPARLRAGPRRDRLPARAGLRLLRAAAFLAGSDRGAED